MNTRHKYCEIQNWLKLGNGIAGEGNEAGNSRVILVKFRKSLYLFDQIWKNGWGKTGGSTGFSAGNQEPFKASQGMPAGQGNAVPCTVKPT